MDVDLSRLPPWSRVAFVARCTRRVQPLFHEAWLDTAEHRREALASLSGSPTPACQALVMIVAYHFLFAQTLERQATAGHHSGTHSQPRILPKTSGACCDGADSCPSSSHGKRYRGLLLSCVLCVFASLRETYSQALSRFHP